MEGYPNKLKMTTKEDCEETSRLELRLCPPGDCFYSSGTTLGINCPPNTQLLKSSNLRVAQPPAVVGWPPVRRSRKNITTSTNSIKVVSLPEKVATDGSRGKKLTSFGQDKSLYVKINMDGVAIGRKVDLKAYDNYQKLSSAVDELFRGLLSAQGDKQTDTRTELLAGNGDYTLVYEDNEGDIVLVGDVPWEMFISSAKRLRVLKTSELSAPHHNVD